MSHRLQSLRFALFTLLATGLVGGCASTSLPGSPDLLGRHADCMVFLGKLDGWVAAAGVRDAASYPVKGYPFLRMSRLLASFANEPMSDAGFRQWINAMAALDRTARAMEIANLPRAEAARSSRAELLSRASECSTRLAHSVKQPGDRQRLVDAVRRPSNYHLARRVLGLYPLFALPLLWRVDHYHDQVKRTFATPLPQLRAKGQRIAFDPPGEDTLSTAQVADLLARSADNPLHIPELNANDANALLRTFAPRWVVDVASRADRIGQPAYSKTGLAEVDTSRPIVFTKPGYTRFAGQVLLQLNYFAWFPARPHSGVIDPLAGRLDGIIWRVTLGTDGVPILYDSVHSCGCYHKFYPTPALHLVRDRVGFEEPILVPQTVTPVRRPTLWISSGSHYVQRVLGESPAVASSEDYRLIAYETLRSLPYKAGRRSLFQPNGIVQGSERGERFFLWPTGILSPGAMREFGHHATAFVGRRTFDDPGLLSRYFEPARRQR